jgi:hypothetical protein
MKATTILHVIYSCPLDYPADIVVRKWQVSPHEKDKKYHRASTLLFPELQRPFVQEPFEQPELFGYLSQARLAMKRRGLACLGRHPCDDPAIVEVWF